MELFINPESDINIHRLGDNLIVIPDAIFLIKDKSTYLITDDDRVITDFNQIVKELASRLPVLHVPTKPSQIAVEKIRVVYDHDSALLANYSFTEASDSMDPDMAFLRTSDGDLHDPERMIEYLEGVRRHYGEKTYLGMPEKIKEVRAASKRAFDAFVAGKKVKLDDKGELARRRKLCGGCPFNQKAKLGRACSRCGCYIKAKTLLKTESCPIGKW